MKKVSVELIPRDINTLESEVKLIKESFPEVNAINIPDLLRFNLRSWEAVSKINKDFPFSIPHLRSMDFPVSDHKLLPEIINPVIDHINKHKIPALLIVRGDKPKDSSKKTFDTSSADLITYFKKEMPNLKLYGALDQYRGSMENELNFIKEKIDAGADGFFTQPFFDIPSMSVYAEKLQKESPNSEIFWGVSPVCSETSKHYWENLNHVNFSHNFDLSLKGNIDFARESLQIVKELDSNIYLMPIKVPLKEYLEGIFR